MLRFRSLGSGSAGNAALVEATSGGRTSRLLIDCGFGIRQLDQRLARAGLAASDIDAIFVTHEHGDHIGCAHTLSRRNRIPVWMSEGTWLATGGRDFEGQLHIARDDEDFAVGELSVHPFTVPHDAREPLQLRCTDGNRTLGVLTDLGHATAHVLARLSGARFAAAGVQPRQRAAGQLGLPAVPEDARGRQLRPPLEPGRRGDRARGAARRAAPRGRGAPERAEQPTRRSCAS